MKRESTKARESREFSRNKRKRNVSVGDLVVEGGAVKCGRCMVMLGEMVKAFRGVSRCERN